MSISDKRFPPPAFGATCAELKKIIDSVPIAITVFDENEEVAYANELSEKLFANSLEANPPGLRCGDFIGCKNRDRHPRGCGYSPDCPNCPFLRAIRSALSGETADSIQAGEALLARDPGREPIWIRYKIRPVKVGGTRMAVLATEDITEQKRTAAALREQEAFQQAIFAASPVALYSIDLAGNVLAWNASAERIFGWSAEEVLGKPLPLVPEEKQEEFRRLRDRVQSGETLTGLELVRRRKDGSAIQCSLSTSPIVDETGAVVAITGAMQDITERKQMEGVLRASEGRYRSLFEHSLEGIMLTAPDGSILDANPAACRMLGRSVEELRRIGRNGVVNLADPRLQSALETRARLGRYQAELTYIRADGTIFPVDVSSTIYFDQDGLQKTSLLVRDISKRKQAEADAERLRDRLTRSQRIESVGRLAGGVAHEFNNKLMVILGYIELALNQIDPVDPLREDLRVVQEAALKSAELVKQLLAFAQKQTIQPVELDLNRKISDMLTMMEVLVGERITLIWSPSAGLWPVRIDPSQIDQVLVNLALNARDAISGTGTLTIETQNIPERDLDPAELENAAPGDYVQLAVRDDGCGMTPEVRKGLFEPFFTTKPFGQSTGLGLAAIHGIVSQNGGFIRVASSPGKGAAFRIFLPRAETASGESRNPLSGSPPLRGKRDNMPPS